MWRGCDWAFLPVCPGANIGLPRGKHPFAPGDWAIFRPDPFHADKISLKRGLMNRPGPGQEWF
ncbi:hypothetical protein GCM10007881_14150 [Mesorhizobium huakuii]|nr:hypothetical protein GCM10007881_14150 [Mesorhizobium huakuii]